MLDIQGYIKRKKLLSEFIGLSSQDFLPEFINSVDQKSELSKKIKTIIGICFVFLVVIIKIIQPPRQSKESKINNNNLSLSSCIDDASNNFIYRKQIACQSFGENPNCTLSEYQIKEIELLKKKELELCSKKYLNKSGE